MKDTTGIIKKKDSKNRTAPYARKSAVVRFKDDTQTSGDELANLFITPKRNMKPRRSFDHDGPALLSPAYDGDVDMDKPQKKRRRSERLKALQCRTISGEQGEEETIGIYPPPTPIKIRRFRKIHESQDQLQEYITKLEAYKKQISELESLVLIQATELQVTRDRNRHLLKYVEVLEQQNVALTGNVRLLRTSHVVPVFGSSCALRSPSPQSAKSESSANTPTDTPALPQRVIDEDYDEGMNLYHLSVARERVRQVYGIQDSMDADETLNQITNRLSERWKIEDEPESATQQARNGPNASGHNHLFSPIPVPRLF